MINKKTGISLPWLSRTNNNNVWQQENIRNLIKNIFLKQNIFISDIYIQEYPKSINLIFNIFLINTLQYKEIKTNIKLIYNIISFITKKNIHISFNLSPSIYSNIDVLIEWLNLKLYNQPSKTKKLLKQILNDSTIK